MIRSVTLSPAGATQLLIDPPLAANSAWSAVAEEIALRLAGRGAVERHKRGDVALQLVVGALLQLDVAGGQLAPGSFFCSSVSGLALSSSATSACQ